jgi:hypothetical protein
MSEHVSRHFKARTSLIEDLDLQVQHGAINQVEALRSNGGLLPTPPARRTSSLVPRKRLSIQSSTFGHTASSNRQ